MFGYHSISSSKCVILGKENTFPDVRVTRDDVQKAVEFLKFYVLTVINGTGVD